MKKITALSLGTLLGLSAIAAPGVVEKITRVDAVRAAHAEKTGKKVKALPAVREREQRNGLTRHRNVKRLALANQAGRKKSPAMISAEGRNLYGMLQFYEDPAEVYDKLGYCLINPETGGYDNVVQIGFTGTAAGQKDGKLYVSGYDSFWGMILGAYNCVYDLETGELLEADEIDISSDINKMFTAAGFDASEGIFYGTTPNDDDEIVFTTYNVESKEYTYLGVTETSQAITYNQETGDVVGIQAVDATTSRLLNYDKVTGEASVIAEVDYGTDYPGGLCYSPEDGGYLWNPNSDDWSKLVLISTSGAVTELCDFEGYPEFTVLFNTDLKKVSPNAPGKPSIDAADFVDASLSGSLTVTMPSVLESGEPLTGEVEYVLSCDGEQIASGSAEAGATLKLDVTVEQGMHKFGLVCGSGELEGREAMLSIYVGNDTPCAPAAVELTATTVSWEAVTEGSHRGYVDAAEVTYTVSLNGVEIAKDIKETSCPTGLPESVQLDLYAASVVASCNGLTSAPATSNDLVYGDPMPLPVDLIPTEKESKLFTVVDENEDGSSWSFYADGKLPGAFRYAYNSSFDADDWLFLPPVQVDNTATLHSFAMQYYVQSSNYPERLEVCIGKAAEASAMTKVLIEPTDLLNTNPELAEVYFMLDEPGAYYIGIHAISDADSYYLYAGDFKVADTGIRQTGPASAEAIEAVAAPEGALRATVSATLPAKALSGDALAADSKVTMTVTSEAGSASVDGAPGEKVSVEVATLQGDNRIRVQTSVGEDLGMIEFVNIYTGIDVPGELTNMTAATTADNLSAKVTWEAPTVGANGGYVAPTGITYYTCVQTIFGWQLGDEIGTDVFEYEVSVPAGSPQSNIVVAIIGMNDAGTGLISAVSVPLGELYETPANEVFPDQSLTYGPVTIYNGDVQMSWTIGDPGDMFGEDFMNNSGSACIGWGSEATNGYLSFPRFNAAGSEKMTLDFSIYCGDIADVVLYASGYGVEEQEVFRLSNVNWGPGYNNFSVELPAAFQNIPWVSFMFEPVLGEDGGHFILESYKLRNVVDNDLAVISIAAQSNAAIGEKIDVIATVENQGLNAIDYKGGVFSLIAPDGKVIATSAVEASKNLASGETEKASAQFDLIAECLGASKVKFELSISDDNALNNAKEAVVNVSRGNAVVVTDLEGKWNEEGSAIDLSWSPAVYEPGFASFENETPFVISSDKIGEFINIDGDEQMVYCWNGAQNIPELSDMAFQPGAFNVINANALDEYFQGDMDAPDGEQCLIAFCPEAGHAADDWLISPELVAGSSFSFYIKPLTLQYGSEILEICYSTGSINPDDFVVFDTLEVDWENWEEVHFELPAEATRFAIHYISDDIFGVMIDAIRYVTKDASELTGYDVYRAEAGKDAEKIAHVEGCAYADADVAGDVAYTYYVVPTLANGTEGEKSNVVEVAPSAVGSLKASRSVVSGKGEIVAKGFAGETLSISNAAGQNFNVEATSDSERISVPAGIYVVKSGKTTVKVIVK